MISISNIIFNILLFLSVYVQVFFLVTFLENRKKISIRRGKTKLTNYSSVTIAVPCWNEESTVESTVRSLLDLDYPKDKLRLVLIDDGSTDGTWNVIRRFADHPNVQIFHKENGGKHAALNWALQHTDTEFFAGLDADSMAHPESLVRIMSYFEKDKSVMAVAPAVLVNNPKKIIQNAQKAEYHMGVYLKKMFCFLEAINVTPGPLTVFRRKVFDDLGPYREGHRTEDMEIAYRMQKNHYKIEHCNDAYVYTNTPTSIKKLYKQRLRWIYGFINNTLDYKNIIFKKEYANFSFFTLPMGIISIVSVCYLFARIIYHLGELLYSKIVWFQTVGFYLPSRAISVDPFFINTQSFVFLVMSLYLLVIFAMIFGKKMVEGRWGLSLGMFYFLPIFSVIAPFWLVSAVYSTVRRRRPSWR